jgi:ATP-dependent Lon protease
MTIVPVKNVSEVLKIALVRQPEAIDWVEPPEVVPPTALTAGDSDAVVTH